MNKTKHPLCNAYFENFSKKELIKNCNVCEAVGMAEEGKPVLCWGNFHPHQPSTTVVTTAGTVDFLHVSPISLIYFSLS